MGMKSERGSFVKTAEADSLTLKELMDMAVQFYPGDTIDSYVGPEGSYTEGMGDSLAGFVISELESTFDPQASRADQLTEASRVMNRGAVDLQDAAASFSDAAGAATEVGGEEG